MTIAATTRFPELVEAKRLLREMRFWDTVFFAGIIGALCTALLQIAGMIPDAQLMLYPGIIIAFRGMFMSWIRATDVFLLMEGPLTSKDWAAKARDAKLITIMFAGVMIFFALFTTPFPPYAHPIGPMLVCAIIQFILCMTSFTLMQTTVSLRSLGKPRSATLGSVFWIPTLLIAGIAPILAWGAPYFFPSLFIRPWMPSLNAVSLMALCTTTIISAIVFMLWLWGFVASQMARIDAFVAAQNART